MRKADYQTLASIVKNEIDCARPFLVGNSAASDRAQERIASAIRIARAFAASAAVDRTAFLKACGIAP